MNDTIDAIKENYQKNLKAREYVDLVQKDIDEDENCIKDPLKFTYDVLRSGRFKGSKLLDIGCGPVVHHVALPSAFYPNIIMCDYVEDLCEELKRWLKGQSKLSERFLGYPAELAGYGGNLEAGKELLAKRIRKCVKQVARCDIMDDNFFLEEVKPEVAPPYDFITAFWCLDVVPPDFDSFVLVLKRIYKLLKPGGGFIFAGDFNENWEVGEKTFHHLYISEDEVKKAVKESGFRIIDMKVAYYEDTDSKTEDGKQKSIMKAEYYSLAAEKPSC